MAEIETAFADWQWRRNWTVAQLLRKTGADKRIRQRVREHRLLESVTLGELMDEPRALRAFLGECARLPQCGEVQIERLREALLSGLRDPMPAEEVTRPLQRPGLVAGLDAPARLGPADIAGPGEDALEVAGVFHPDSIAAMEQVYLRMWRLAHFNRFVYLPSSVPEFAKAPAVLSAEIGPRQDLELYRRRFAGFRHGLEALEGASGLILVDRQALCAVLQRQGRYAGLGDDEVRQQFEALREMCAALPEGVLCLVAEFEQARLSSAAIVGEFVVLHVMGGYIVLHDPPMLPLLLDRVEAVSLNAQSLSAFLATLG